MRRTLGAWLAGSIGVPLLGACTDTHYQCGSNWVQKALANGEVTYVGVKPPPGF